MRRTALKISRALFGWPPAPAPLADKQALIKRVAREHDIHVFVETGTFQGEMIAAQLEHFQKLISIELSEELHRACCEKFAGNSKVQLHQGDSGVKLCEVAGSLNEPALFWLDAHYSRGVTAGGGKDAPIMRELSCLAQRKELVDAILIDDARLFGLKSDYPKIETVRRFVETSWPKHTISVESDVICITPKR